MSINDLGVFDLLQGQISELLRLSTANHRDNPVETAMRLRALAEISEHLDTETLFALAEHITTKGREDVVDLT